MGRKVLEEVADHWKAVEMDGWHELVVFLGDKTGDGNADVWSEEVDSGRGGYGGDDKNERHGWMG